MSNIMSMVRVKNNTSRNGFDLSKKVNFTAKAGELLPVYVKEVIPGDKINIDLSAFARTMPVNTAAFARIRQYYDFFFVPFSCLWNRANSVLTQMNYNQMHATGLADFDNVYNGEMPYVTCGQISTYLSNVNSLAISNEDRTGAGYNYFGYSRYQLSLKLLQYLGYGDYSNLEQGAPYRLNAQVNIFGLLAYQKIYADFYRDEQWEKPQPSTFNVDYMDGVSSMNVNIPTSTSDPFIQNYNMFDMRYCNWQKDLFHGLLPNSQYGEEAVVPLTLGDGVNITNSSQRIPVLTGSQAFGSIFVDGTTASTPTSPATYQVPGTNGTTGWQYITGILGATDYNNGSVNVASLSILALRQYEYLQKWKEIAQSSPQNYKDQVKAMWGVDVSQHLSHKCKYLGGINSSMDINEVVNTNITADNSAEIAGKGYGVTNGKIEFNSDGQFGLIMCIYHALPLVDYTAARLQPEYLRVNAEDFANPVFDKIGMEPVNSVQILNFVDGISGTAPISAAITNLGYAPRYIDYKTDIDISLGAFRTSLSHWVVSYGWRDMYNALSTAQGISDTDVPADQQPAGTGIVHPNYTFFKVDPAILDPIFVSAADDTLDTDQFLCSTFFDVKAVRNLDVNGLPY